MARKIHVHTTINGVETEFLCEPRQSLLEVLRDELHLTGSKEGCNNGNCGACNVILDGRLVNSCCVLGAEVQGRTVSTIEGMATPEGLHPLQQKFMEHAALQCGICTPGFIMASKALLDQNPRPTEHQVRHFLAGNLCRCTGYDKIIRAVLDTAKDYTPAKASRPEKKQAVSAAARSNASDGKSKKKKTVKKTKKTARSKR